LKNIIFCCCLLAFVVGKAQNQVVLTDNNIKVVLNSDGTWSNTANSESAVLLNKYTKWVNPKKDILKDNSSETYSIHKYININNGLNRAVTINLLWLFGKKAPTLSLKTINIIILQSNFLSKNFVKDPKSYAPIGFYITRSNKENNEKGAWKFHSKFKGLNAYGQVGQFDKFFFFNAEGKLLKD
jgi:hypothetical protein